MDTVKKNVKVLCEEEDFFSFSIKDKIYNINFEKINDILYFIQCPVGKKDIEFVTEEERVELSHAAHYMKRKISEKNNYRLLFTTGAASIELHNFFIKEFNKYEENRMYGINGGTIDKIVDVLLENKEEGGMLFGQPRLELYGVESKNLVVNLFNRGIIEIVDDEEVLSVFKVKEEYGGRSISSIVSFSNEVKRLGFNISP